MMCDKCMSGRGLCPVTLGLSLGITCALGILFWSAWVMWFGVPAMIEGQMYMMKAAENWSDAGIWAVWGLVKGFVFGFVLALIYDMICRCKSKCCGKCSCCDNGKK
ncbi:MAG TPA: hypothetical protein VL360_03800 [Gammaproteobacteria bacterium]|nr:hypothetical protein [Gammaproteobacteria bacterium]